MEKINVLLRMPKSLLYRVDAYQHAHGFTTRTQALMHLLHVALDASER